MSSWQVHTVATLQGKKALLVEDGNHGEYRPLKHEFVLQGTPFIRPPDLGGGRIDFAAADHINDIAFQRVRKGIGAPCDILFSHRATVGRMAKVPDDAPVFVVNPGITFYRVLDKKLLYPDFLYYWMQTAQFMDQVWAVAGGSDTFPYVSLGEQRKLAIHFPTIEVQCAIGRVLRSLDDKIELNRKTAATLEEMARALYRSWFVDFDPVWAKAEGRTPAHMDAATAALFPDSFGDDGLPVGWELTSIGEVGHIVGGSTPSTKKPEFWEGGEHLWATPKDLSGLGQPVLFQTERRVTDLGLAQISSGLSPEGTLLLSSRAPIGYLAIAQAPVAVNQGFIAISETEKLSGVEAYCWCHENMDAIHANANGSTFQEISKKNFRPLPYILAPEAVRETFNRDAKSLFSRLQTACAENQTLAALRDTLLPKLMSGELRVGEAQELVEAVA